MKPINKPLFNAKDFTWRDGKDWFDAGVLLFKQVKNHWYMACLLLVLLLALMSNVSQDLVAILVVFSSPLITAYMMNCCQLAKKQQALSWTGLWQPVFSKLNHFLILGAVTAILSLLFNYIHTQVLVAFDLPVILTEEMVKNLSGKESIFRALLNLMTNIPIALALAFSPALILFNNTLPVSAIKYSALGVIRSWKAFVSLVLLFLLLFFGIVLFASLMMAILQAVLGSVSQFLMTFVVLFFVITAGGIGLGAQYQAYTEIYVNTDDTGDGTDKDDHGTEIYTEI